MSGSVFEAKRKAEAKAMQEWASKVIPYFTNPEAWQFDDKWQGYGVKLYSREGLELLVYREVGKKDRVVISGCFSNSLIKHLPYEREKTDITVGWERPPKAVARDIERRLLPGYKRMLVQVKASKEESDRREEEKENALKNLTDALPNDSFRRDVTLRAYNFHNFLARWQAYHRNFEVKFDVPLDKLLKIIEILKTK